MFMSAAPIELWEVKNYIKETKLGIYLNDL